MTYAEFLASKHHTVGNSGKAGKEHELSPDNQLRFLHPYPLNGKVYVYAANKLWGSTDSMNWTVINNGVLI